MKDLLVEIISIDSSVKLRFDGEAPVGSIIGAATQVAAQGGKIKSIKFQMIHILQYLTRTSVILQVGEFLSNRDQIKAAMLQLRDAYGQNCYTVGLIEKIRNSGYKYQVNLDNNIPPELIVYLDERGQETHRSLVGELPSGNGKRLFTESILIDGTTKTRIVKRLLFKSYFDRFTFLMNHYTGSLNSIKYHGELELDIAGEWIQVGNNIDPLEVPVDLVFKEYIRTLLK